MKKCLAILFMIGTLYCLAYLPSFVFYVFVGQHFTFLFGTVQKYFMFFNSLFVILFLTFIFWPAKGNRPL